MDSPLFPTATTAPVKKTPRDGLGLDAYYPAEVITDPAPASFELMPRADGAERFQPLVKRIDDHEALAMSLAVTADDSDDAIRAKAAQARRLRLDVFRPSRVEADKLHADLKAGVLEIGRKLDKARADFRARCEKVENHLAEIENELKNREEAAAAARLAARAEAIAPYAIAGLPLPAWPDDEDQFQTILSAQKSAHAGWQAQLEAERKAKEEADRKAEEERKAAEAQRQQELAEARKAKAEADAKLEAERKAMAEQQKQQQAELERIRRQNEAKLAAEREQRRKEREAEAERERERQAAENERKRQEQIRERERQAAKAKLEQAARMLAAALTDAQPALDGDLAAAAAAALAYWSEVEAAL